MGLKHHLRRRREGGEGHVKWEDKCLVRGEKGGIAHGKTDDF